MEFWPDIRQTLWEKGFWGAGSTSRKGKSKSQSGAQGLCTQVSWKVRARCGTEVLETESGVGTTARHRLTFMRFAAAEWEEAWKEELSEHTWDYEACHTGKRWETWRTLMTPEDQSRTRSWRWGVPCQGLESTPRSLSKRNVWVND